MALKSGTYRFHEDGEHCVLKQGDRIIGIGHRVKAKTAAQQRKTTASAEARLRAFNFNSTSLSDTP